MAIAGATFAVTVAAILGLWVTSTATLRDNYRRYLTSLAVTASQVVDLDIHDKLRDPAQLNQADYIRAVAPLRRIRGSVANVRYIYTMVGDGDEFRFVLDAAEPGDHDGDGIEDQSGVWEIYLCCPPWAAPPRRACRLQRTTLSRTSGAHS